MKFPLYSIGYGLAGFVLAPYFLIKGLFSDKYLWNLKARMGFINIDFGPKEKTRIWVHGLSLGEIQSSFGLIDELQQEGYDLCLSTTTRSGFELAQERFGLNNSEVKLFQFPFDWLPAIRRVQDNVKPDLFVLVETDIWPNFLAQLKSMGCPSILVNARVSDRSLRRLTRFKGWWGEVLNLFTIAGVQTSEDGERLRSLGLANDKIHVTGNLKFDASGPDRPGGPSWPGGPDSEPSILKSGKPLDFLPNFLPSFLPRGFWIMGGSTHAPEEKVLLKVYKNLRLKYPDLKLLLAPRDKQRFDAVWSMINNYGFAASRRSSIHTDSEKGRGKEIDIFLLDTYGELDRFYEKADLVYIGKSLDQVKEGGGQNPLEPARWSKPVISGPRTENFKAIYELLLDAGAAIMVRTTADLEAALDLILGDRNKLEQMGKKAGEIAASQRGAVLRTKSLIQGLLERRER